MFESRGSSDGSDRRCGLSEEQEKPDKIEIRSPFVDRPAPFGFKTFRDNRRGKPPASYTRSLRNLRGQLDVVSILRRFERALSIL